MFSSEVINDVFIKYKFNDAILTEMHSFIFYLFIYLFIYLFFYIFLYFNFFFGVNHFNQVIPAN